MPEAREKEAGARAHFEGAAPEKRPSAPPETRTDERAPIEHVLLTPRSRFRRAMLIPVDSDSD